MQARALSVAKACARSEDPLAGARLVTSQAAWPRDVQQDAQTALLKEMTTFSRVLADCKARWTAMSVESSQSSLREGAPYQMKLLEDRLNLFNETARAYLRRIGIKLPPMGTS